MITIEDALEYAMRVTPDLFWEAMANVPEPVAEFALEQLAAKGEDDES